MSEAVERVGRVRRGRREGGFTVVRNDLINHPTLAIEARGLMIYLLSRPDDWELRISDVRRFLGRDGRPCGRDKAYGVVKELKQAGYLVMCEDVNGQHFAGVTYYVFDEPVTDPEAVQRRHRSGEDALAIAESFPLPEKPDADVIPLPDFTDTENQHATNKRYIQTTNPPSPPKQRKRTRLNGSGIAGDAPAVDTTRLAEPWSIEWMEYRLRLLWRGREQSPAKPSSFIAGLIARGGDAGERERLAHEARTCWPTIQRMDEAAADARCWRVPAGLYAEGLAENYRSVRVDSVEFERWQEAHQVRGWPTLQTPRRAECVWLPISGVACLDVPNVDGHRIAG